MAGHEVQVDQHALAEPACVHGRLAWLRDATFMGVRTVGVGWFLGGGGEWQECEDSRRCA